MDSRHYIFSFRLESLSEIPPDFDLPPDLDALEAGVFLPQGDSDWLGRRKYPARILLLTKREVVVVAHPTAGEPLTRVPFDCIDSVECGRILLLGWITFSWVGSNKNLSYNTRTAGPVEAYVERFMDQWLPEVTGLSDHGYHTVGARLNSKFEYARTAELSAGETPLVQFFQPPFCGVRGSGVSRRETRSSGDLVVATSRRLLWITERHRGDFEPYGTISRSVPASAIVDLRYLPGNNGGDLAIVRRSGDSWYIPLQDGGEQKAREFEASVKRAFRGIARELP